MNSIIYKYCSIYINIQGFNLITTTNHGVYVEGCIYARFVYLNILGSAGIYAGIYVVSSFCSIWSSTISNKAQAINAIYMSTVLSHANNSGNGNVIGLQATNGATIGKNSTQPTGTTAESTTSGGVIR